MEKKWRSESFEMFVKNKENQLDDLNEVVQRCHDKVVFMRDFFCPPQGFDPDTMTEETAEGIAWILMEMADDLEMVSDEITNHNKKKGQEEKKNGTTWKITPEKIERVNEEGKEAV